MLLLLIDNIFLLLSIMLWNSVLIYKLSLMKGILELATASQSINEKKIFQQSNIRKEFANIREEIFNIDQENI